MCEYNSDIFISYTVRQYKKIKKKTLAIERYLQFLVAIAQLFLKTHNQTRQYLLTVEYTKVQNITLTMSSFNFCR